METFALYLLKSVTWLSGFALVFFLFLKNERFFLLNRIYLLSGILISFLFPLISVHYSVVLPVVTGIQTGSAVATGIQAVSKNPFLNIGVILSILYFSGVLCVSFLIIKQSRPVFKAIHKAEIITTQAVKLIRTAEYPSSFSFFSYVFVNPSITDVETEEIVNHELAHIRQWHWLDLVLVELLCMLQWFNPLIWIYIRFIRQNHEYLADEVALQRSSDPAVYKATLLNQIVGSPVVSLANSFNYSLNKKRFNMMKNIISSPYRKMKIFLILPVFVIVLYAFATPEYKYIDSPGTVYPLIQSLTKVVKGNVVQQDGKSLLGATIVVQGTTFGASTDSKGYFLLDKVPEDATLVVSFVGFKTKVVKPVFTSPMTIKMLRDTVNLPGVSTPPPPPPPVKIRSADGKSPLIVVDGVIKDIDVEYLDPETIASMNVIKDKTAIDKYGDKGKDGVIEITTKDQNYLQKKTLNADNVLKQQPVIEEMIKTAGEKTFVVVEEMPEFPGGNDAMRAWISHNMNYPADATKAKISGTVEVNFLISSTGKVKNVTVSKPLYLSLDAEAIRVVSGMPDWKPGTQAGKPVDVQMKVPMTFILRETKTPVEKN